MTLTKDYKAEVIGKYGQKDGDTGSTEVQVALLTERCLLYTSDAADE